MWPWARAALPQFWDLQPAWSPAEPSQASPQQCLQHQEQWKHRLLQPWVPWYLSQGALCRVNAAMAVTGEPCTDEKMEEFQSSK